MTGKIDEACRVARCGDVPAHRIVFQPLVSARSGAVVGYEALARFDDGRPPAAHLADPRPGIVELELALACSAVAAAAAIPAQYAVTINLSARSIAEPAMRSILPRGRRWGIELLETSILDADSRVREHVDDLDALLLIDDAGTDQASVERIVALRPDVVKIDKSLVWRACAEATHGEALADTLRLQAYLDAARSVGARTLAEGVETERHRRLAVDTGIDYAQGYLYGAPAAYGG
ncbi:EAL domain-containing protein [Microbacterium sp. Marseille-Q6965]|uniref:EAL domain-containing protein n=1 Tax=Microbacterium sp. Marseille-Q6965 TaxID=2965072 RepID=UPI0021B845C8|nr:EAL domain-containing protein [Microbacterium sp. Marseille-Q6965]